MCGKLFLLLASFGVIACAKPVYENAPEKSSINIHQDKAQADCQLQFKKSGICMSWAWEKMPTESEAGTIIFKTYRPNAYDQSQVQVDPEYTPNVILWMPAMGHGSSPTKVSRLDVGTFQASQVFFVMPGEWEIKFQLKDGNVLVDEVVVSLSI
jgi:hypothetical protein